MKIRYKLGNNVNSRQIFIIPSCLASSPSSRLSLRPWQAGELFARAITTQQMGRELHFALRLRQVFAALLASSAARPLAVLGLLLR